MSEQPMSSPDPMPAREPAEVLPPRRRRGLRPLTAVLVAVVLVGAGFLGGVQIQKRYGGSSTAAAGRSALAARFAAAGVPSFGGAGGSSFFGAAGSGQSGTAGGTQEVGQVTVVKGSIIYMSDFYGNTVRVRIPAGVNVSETTAVAVKGIHPGDTVTAQVKKLANGDYSATSVTLTPASGN